MVFLSVFFNISFPQDGLLFPQDRDAVDNRANRIKKLRRKKLLRKKNSEKEDEGEGKMNQGLLNNKDTPPQWFWPV